MTFVETCPRIHDADDHLLALSTALWRPALFALYLVRGTAIPEDVKRCSGAHFGFCDCDGAQRPQDVATHVGWTLDPPQAAS